MKTSIGKRIFFVVAVSEDSGKTLVGEYLVRKYGTPMISSSALLEDHCDVLLGLPAGTIHAARAKPGQRNAYRQDLVDEGDRMRAAGFPPGVQCVREGYRIVDGLRAGDELAASIAYARSVGLDPFVLCLDRFGKPPTDNTDVPGLTALADAYIHNAWIDDKKALFEAVEDAISGRRSFPAPGRG